MARTANDGFLPWLREVIQPQADPAKANAVALDDFSRDGMKEYCYPKSFVVQGDSYFWSVSTAHTKGRHLCTHYELWFHGPAFAPCQRIATGAVTKAAIRKGLRQIYRYYYRGGLKYMPQVGGTDV